MVMDLYECDRHLYAAFGLICLACFMMYIFLCCMLFSCFNIDVSVFIFGKKLCRAYAIMLYTCRIKIKFFFILSYLILMLTCFLMAMDRYECGHLSLDWLVCNRDGPVWMSPDLLRFTCCLMVMGLYLCLGCLVFKWLWAYMSADAGIRLTCCVMVWPYVKTGSFIQNVGINKN
jgi:hypothetical protein